MTAAGTRIRPARLGPLDLAPIAWHGLTTHRLRSGLTGLGIAIGIAAMVAVVGIAESSRATLLSELDRIGSNLLTVTAGQTFLGGDSGLPDESTAMIGRVGPVTGASGVAATAATVRRTDLVPSTRTGGIAVQAADLDLLETLDGSVAVGRFLDPATARFPTVVLGSVAAERLGIRSVEPGVRVWIGEQWWDVVGILDAFPLAPEVDRSALVGAAAAETYLDADTNPSTIYVRAVPDEIDDVRAVLASTANPESPEAVQVSRPSDAIEARAAAATAFTTLLVGLGAVALLVGALGIANVMLIAVLERRNEIGLRRALGATRGQILGQFLTEAAVLSGAGGMAGAAIGSVVAIVYARSQGWLVSIPPVVLAGAVLAAAGVGVAAGLYPAIRAARTTPTEALRA